MFWVRGKAEKNWGGGKPPSLDIKYCRGAVVSPPSKSHKGGRYTWVRFMKPALLPQEVIAYLIKARKKQYPNVTRYRTWSQDPAHKGKKP